MAKRKKDEQEKLKRRARGEGTVVERADGRFVARIPLGGGKRKEEYYDTKQEAERAKRRMLNERDEGRLVTERDITLEEYLFYWLKMHRPTIELTTYAMYKGYLTTRVIPELGYVPLRKLTVDMFQELYQEWSQELSPNTIRLIHTIMKKALKDAVRWKKIGYSPIEYVKVPRERKARVYVFSEEEIDRLLQCARKMSLYPLFKMALFLGMREGELIGLKWSDIDFQQAKLQVQRTVSYIRDPDTGKCRYIEGTPKTDVGTRVIYLPHDIIRLLQAHREKQAQSPSASKNVLGLVFCTRTGNYINCKHVQSWFDKLLKKAGLEHTKFHALRHNASLILRRMGIDSVVRREMLGHKSLEMTDVVYGHSTPEMHQQAADKIGRLFSENQEEEEEK